MQLQSLSSTLPRRWRPTSSSRDPGPGRPSQVGSPPKTVIIDGKPPKSEGVRGSPRKSSRPQIVPPAATTGITRSMSFSDNSVQAFQDSVVFKKPYPVPGPGATAGPPSKQRRPSFSKRIRTTLLGLGKAEGDDPPRKVWRSLSLIDLEGFQHETGPPARRTFSKASPEAAAVAFKPNLSAEKRSASLTDTRQVCQGWLRQEPSSDRAGSSSWFARGGGSREGLDTATVFSKNLRSNSWRNLSTIHRVDPASAASSSLGGMNNNSNSTSTPGSRMSKGIKKVTPPVILSLNPRGSGSSFGSDYSFERDDSGYSRDPAAASQVGAGSFAGSSASSSSSSSSSSGAVGGVTTVSYGASLIPKSPGRDSPGDDSSASIGTVESSSVSSSGGCRNSTTSLDSGRASNSNSTTVTDLSSFHHHHTTIHPILEHQRVSVHQYDSFNPYANLVVSGGVQQHNHPQYGVALASSSPSVRAAGQLPPPSSSSFRQSCYSSSSSLGSAATDRGEDCIRALDIHDMIASGVPDHEILLTWLTDLHYEEYYDLFMAAGYDVPTISRMTPEDLTAIGIKKPHHRKRIKAEIANLNVPDCLPEFIPDDLEEWLNLIRLGEYTGQLRSQGYQSVEDVAQISIEDFEDVGVFKLGHQKRLLLAVKRIKELKSGRRLPQYPTGSSCQQQPQQQQLNPLQRGLVPQGPASTYLPQKTQQMSSFQPAGVVMVSQPMVSLPHYRTSSSAAGLVPAQASGLNPSTTAQTSNSVTLARHAPVYRPEVIKIEVATGGPKSRDSSRPQSQMDHHQQPEDEVEVLAMPRPMAPLSSNYAFFQAQRGGLARSHLHGHPPPPTPERSVSIKQQQPQTILQLQNHADGLGGLHMMRSLDDADIRTYEGNGVHPFQPGCHLYNPGPLGNSFGAHHPMSNGQMVNNALIHNSGGGTLPRHGKGLVKPRPVAMIAATQQQHQQQMSDGNFPFENEEPYKKHRQVSSFSSSMEQVGTGYDVGGSRESFPFANDNVGTIRMRSNSHVPRLSSHSSWLEGSPVDDDSRMGVVRSSSASKMSGIGVDTPTRTGQTQQQKRSTGDVLNDIGSMLADLTDELDAMLHMDRSSNSSSSAAKKLAQQQQQQES